MKELVFALEFRGSAAPVPGSDKKLQAKTSATSQTLRSVLKADGIQAGVESAAGGSASFESEVEIVGEGMFVESGASGTGMPVRSLSGPLDVAPLVRAQSPKSSGGRSCGKSPEAKGVSQAHKVLSRQTSRSGRTAKWWTTSSPGSSYRSQPQ
jgi:hypothetical protein